MKLARLTLRETVEEDCGVGFIASSAAAGHDEFSTGFARY